MKSLLKTIGLTLMTGFVALVFFALAANIVEGRRGICRGMPAIYGSDC